MRKIPFSPPDITEEEIAAVADTLRSGWITTGPKTKEFERQLTEYTGAAGTACLASATAALECTLRLLGIGAGDEVITSAYTYTASASAIYHVGAKIKLCDTAPDSFFMDYDKLCRLITPKTKAIIAVDVGGVMCNYDEVFAAVTAKSLLFSADNDIQQSFGRCVVIADAAHSLGASNKGKMSGAVADFTCFSFHAVKNLTTAEGGAAQWKKQKFIDDGLLYKQYMLQSLHGQNKDALAKTKAGAWEYDIVAPLYKCNMTDIMAAIGTVQLKRYPALLKIRRDIVDIYNEVLSDERFIKPKMYGNDFESSYHLYQLRINGFSADERNRLVELLAETGISTNVHYKPLPMLTAYKNLGFNIKDYPNAYAQFVNEVTLPLNSKMTLDDAKYVAQAVVKTAENIIG